MRTHATDLTTLRIQGIAAAAYGYPAKPSADAFVKLTFWNSVANIDCGVTMPPAEARIFAAMLLAAADKAEGAPYDMARWANLIEAATEPEQAAA